MKREQNKSRARTVCFVLTVAADVVAALFLDVMGGIGFCMNGYEKVGISLFVSAALLTAAVVLTGFGKMIIPAVLCIFGTIAYIYPIRAVLAIPNTLIPKTATEPLAQRIYPTAAVSIAIVAMIVFNYFSESNIRRREQIRAEKQRDLRDDEKII
ncbi:MAG: hypothetical protein II773_12795 [Oscillospiraceae bacterium]|nr:hypothetical protein [Oscillospiraceae bacterium]